MTAVCWSCCLLVLGLCRVDCCLLVRWQVDYFAGYTLRFFSIAIAVLVGWAMYHLLPLLTSAVMAGQGIGYVLGIIAGLLTYAVTAMLAGILLIVVNTVYICYMLDLDNAYVPAGKSVEIHALYGQAVDARRTYMRSNPKRWAKTGQGKREMTASTRPNGFR